MCQNHTRRQFVRRAGAAAALGVLSTVLSRIHNSFLTEEQKAKVLAGNLEALLARFPA